MQAYPSDTFNTSWYNANTNNTMPSTAVQLFQNGTLYSLNVPGSRNPREVERIQEIMQNTNFGTTNLMKSMDQDSINFLRNHYYCSEKIVGGNFDGLSKQEAEYLEENGWAPGSTVLSGDQTHSLPERSGLESQPTDSIVAPAQVAAELVVSHQSHPADTKTNSKTVLAKRAPAAYVVRRNSTRSLSSTSSYTRDEITAETLSEMVRVVIADLRVDDAANCSPWNFEM